MLTKKKILDAAHEKQPYDIPHFLNSMRMRWNNKRIKRAQKIAVLIIIAITAFAGFIAVGEINKIVGPTQVEDYFVNDDFNKIIDPSNHLIGEKRNSLLEATRETTGSIYKIIYVVSEDKTLEKSVKNTNYNLSNFSLYTCEGKNNKFYLDTVVIVHNVNTEEYALLTTRHMVEKTHVYDRVDTTAITDSTSDMYVPDSVNMSTNQAYAELFNGTPAEVYTQVFEYVKANGYSEDEMNQMLLNRVDSDNLNERVNAYLTVFFILIFTAVILCFVACVKIDNWETPNRIYTMFRECEVILLNEEKEKRQVEREAKVKAEAEIAAKARQEEFKRQIAMNPMQNLIDNLLKIESSNEKINNRRDDVVKAFNVANAILANEENKDNPLINRFKSYYMKAFAENLEDIIFHAQKHATRFDTPEETEVILKTFDVYEKITTKFIDQSEAAGTQNIGVNLTVIEQMAAMDGLSDSEFKPNPDTAQQIYENFAKTH